MIYQAESFTREKSQHAQVGNVEYVLVPCHVIERSFHVVPDAFSLISHAWPDKCQTPPCSSTRFSSNLNPTIRPANLPK